MMRRKSSPKWFRRGVARAALGLLAGVLSLAACASDSTQIVAPKGSALLPPSLSTPTMFESVPEYFEDDGPFPGIGSTANSRCPDQEKYPGVFISKNLRMHVSAENPEDPGGSRIQFKIPLQFFKFYQYVSQGSPISKAIYRSAFEVTSEDGAWKIESEGAFTVNCHNGEYFQWPIGLIIKWRGQIEVVHVDHIVRKSLEDEAIEPAPPPCDDPMTELEEEYPNCAEQSGGYSSGGGDHEEVIQVSYVGGSPRKLMCTVTDWYELVGGVWEYQDTVVDWGSCAWE